MGSQSKFHNVNEVDVSSVGVMAFRAELQLAPAGPSVASAGAELRPRDKLFGFVAAVAPSGPLLTSGRLGPRMQSFSEASAAGFRLRLAIGVWLGFALPKEAGSPGAPILQEQSYALETSSSGS